MRKYLLCLAVLLAPLGALALAQNQERAAFDWAQWRGPHRDGISREKGLLTEWPTEGPPLLWDSSRVNPKGKGVGRGYSSVAVARGRIYTMGDKQPSSSVFCLDDETGKILWSTPLAGADGDGPRCTPTVDGDRVYALTRHGVLACLAAGDGRLLWEVDFQKDFGGRMMSGWDYSESPLVDGDKLICTPGADAAAVVALDKNTGEVLWKSRIPNCGGAGYASVMVAEVGGVRQYLTLFGRCLAGVRADNGAFLWRYDRVANETANIPTPIVTGDLVFCSTAYGKGSALLQLVPAGDGTAAKELYFLRGNELQNHHGGVVLLGEHVYGGHGHNDGQPFCLHLKTGKFAWGPERGVGEGSAAVVYADGRLYFRYQDGTMALIEATPEAYRPVSEFRLPRHVGTPSWPHPVVANGRLYVRGNDCVLCYDVRQK